MDILKVLQDYIEEEKRQNPKMFEYIEKLNKLEESERYKLLIRNIKTATASLEMFKVFIWLEEKLNVTDEDLTNINIFIENINKKIMEEAKKYGKKYFNKDNIFDVDGFGFNG